MRILYYNWVDYLDDEARGGGVSVYQRNLIRELMSQEGVEVCFLSSGVSYDLSPNALRWQQVRHGGLEDRVRRFEIVNSGVLAPAHYSFGDEAQLSHPATEAVFFDFVEKTGPYDVIHFNNLEGLPVDVLALKHLWPDTQVILSLHNYYPICPQVNLWYQERRSCDDFAGGRNCADCLPHQHNGRLLRLAGGVAYRLKRLGLRPKTWAFDTAFKWSLRIGGRVSRLVAKARRRSAPMPTRGEDGQHFIERRAHMIAQINAYCDVVLCVSDAVRQLAENYGINERRLQSSYIGTREAEAFLRTKPRPIPVADDQSLTLAYLGYMRRDKGFFFLLDALESLPEDQARRLRVVIAARRLDDGGVTEQRLMRLRTRLKELRYHDGYHHDGLDHLLEHVDVGVIPVLWHDNLPQVAIEMHARHIPLLCADMGGARELGACDEMVFSAGNVTEFHERISALLSGNVDFDRYWLNAKDPVTMEAHRRCMMRLYRGESADTGHHRVVPA